MKCPAFLGKEGSKVPVRKRATRSQVTELIRKNHKRIFGKRKIKVYTNGVKPPNTCLGRGVQVYDAQSGILLMRAPNNYTTVDILESNYTYKKIKPEGFFKEKGEGNGS